MENLTVLRLLLPMLLFHFLVFFCFVLSYATSYSIRHLFSSDSAFRAYLAGIYIGDSVHILKTCSDCSHLHSLFALADGMGSQTASNITQSSFDSYLFET
ncbi:hypothetical protein ANCCAN_09516 [Ancylostoma caninum]|uniref:Uncharacterized protein n=1 Tax=Ancylostoma caninum TaxID=29170 RepID=A0A368GNF2_ANCCA|nr:hypothetical protein ANCCAN_09516 [Ancylostoma caninum]